MTTQPTPLYVRLLARLVRPFPNFDFGFIKPVRQAAVLLLRLRSGDCVLDAGCGSGGSFPMLVEAVGAAGKVVGIEIAPISAAHARHRAATNGWINIEVLTSSAEKAELTDQYDGLLMFAAPDIYGSKESLAQLIPHLREGARVVFFGSKTSKRRNGWLLNSALNLAMTKLSLSTTPRLDTEPWRLAAEHLSDLVIEEYFYGWMFLAAGTFHVGQRGDA